MTGTLALVDAGTASDLRTFVARAAAADREGAMRLQAQGTVLAAYAAVLPGSGLAAEGLVMGLRTMRLAEPADLTSPSRWARSWTGSPTTRGPASRCRRPRSARPGPGRAPRAPAGCRSGG